MFVTKKWYLFSLVVVALLLAACVAAPQPAAPAEPEQAAPTQSEEEPAEAPADAEAGGGTVRVGWAGSPDTLNPGTAILVEAYDMFELVYDTLYDLELDGSFRPALADMAVGIMIPGTGARFKLQITPGAQVI